MTTFVRYGPARGLRPTGRASAWTRPRRDGHTTRRGDPWDATQVKRVLARGEGPIGRATSASDVGERRRRPTAGRRDEYERWLDAIAPTAEELEHRERCDAFLGHAD